MLVAVLQRCSSSASGKIYWKLQKEKALHRNLKPRAKKGCHIKHLYHVEITP